MLEVANMIIQKHEEAYAGYLPKATISALPSATAFNV